MSILTVLEKWKAGLIAATAFLAALLAAYVKGRSDANTKTQEKAKAIEEKAAAVVTKGKQRVRKVQSEKINTRNRDHFSK